MGRFKDNFYKYKSGDIVLACGFFPALFKVDTRGFGLDWLPYYIGTSIGLIQDDDYIGKKSSRLFSLDKFELKEEEKAKVFRERYKEKLLCLPEPEMFHKGTLEFAMDYFSKH